MYECLSQINAGSRIPGTVEMLFPLFNGDRLTKQANSLGISSIWKIFSSNEYSIYK